MQTSGKACVDLILPAWVAPFKGLAPKLAALAPSCAAGGVLGQDPLHERLVPELALALRLEILREAAAVVDALLIGTAGEVAGKAGWRLADLLLPLPTEECDSARPSPATSGR